MNTVRSKDELLVLKCRQGDAAALDELLRGWQEPLWRYALRLTGKEDAAWDVLQETLIAIARNVNRLEADAAFGAWAYRIAACKATDWLRKNIRSKEREARYAEQQRIENEEPEDFAPRGVEISQYLNKLKAGERTLLMLRFQSHLNLNEIAQMLGVPIGTVKSRMHSARQHLHTLMKGKL